MELDEARELARALILEGVDSPGGKSERLEEIERFIDELGGQVRRRKDRARHDRRGVKQRCYDLEIDADAKRRLMRAAWLLWRVAMDDHEMRYDPNKPSKRLEDNWNPDDPDYDYGDDTGLGLEDWDAFWAEVYHTRPHRRWPGPALPPLYEVYLLVRAWWLRYQDRKSFRPTYGGRRENFNAEGRLFLDVARALDPRYTPSNCASVYEKWRVRKKYKSQKRRTRAR